MNHLNLVLVEGNLAQDPTTTSVGTATKAAFSIGLNRSFKDANGTRKQEASFVKIECWGDCAENAGKYLEKGSLVRVSGRLHQARWEHEGKQNQQIVIIADRIDYLSSAKSKKKVAS